MIRVGVADPLRESGDVRVVRRAPVLVVVAVHPDDVREVPVAPAEVLAVGVKVVDAVVDHRAEPPSCLGGIEHHDEAVVRGQAKNPVDVCEVRFVRGREVAGRCERRNAVPGTPVGPAAGVGVTEQVDPHGVESVRPTVCEEERGIRFRQVADQCLRRFAADQKRNAVLVDEIPSGRSDGQRPRANRGRRGCGDRGAVGVGAEVAGCVRGTHPVGIARARRHRRVAVTAIGRVAEMCEVAAAAALAAFNLVADNTDVVGRRRPVELDTVARSSRHQRTRRRGRLVVRLPGRRFSWGGLLWRVGNRWSRCGGRWFRRRCPAGGGLHDGGRR